MRHSETVPLNEKRVEWGTAVGLASELKVPKLELRQLWAPAHKAKSVLNGALTAWTLGTCGIRFVVFRGG